MILVWWLLQTSGFKVGCLVGGGGCKKNHILGLLVIFITIIISWEQIFLKVCFIMYGSSSFHKWLSTHYMLIVLWELDHLRSMRRALYCHAYLIGEKMEVPQRGYTATRYRSSNWTVRLQIPFSSPLLCGQVQKDIHNINNILHLFILYIICEEWTANVFEGCA